MLADVIGKLREDQRQAALDLDPEGSSELAASQLDESEARILRNLITDHIDDNVEDIRIHLTRGRELTYEAVEKVLGRLWVRGYVEEFSPGRWKTTDLALHHRRRLFGPTLEPA